MWCGGLALALEVLVAVSLATAYVEILPATQKLGQELSKQLTGSSGPVAKAGKSAGNRFTAALGKTVKVGAIAAGAAVGGLFATAMAKGWGRLTAIEDAQAKLKGLGNDTKSVDKIMKNALASVKGTAFGLDEAATTAAGAVAAGIKPGAELEGVLKSVANSAASAGTDMTEMGAIYNKVASNGKAQNDDLQQVAAKGIPIYQALATQLGVTNSEVFDMASKGKINFAQFEKAMTSASGTVAEELGKTATGSIRNFSAALGRFGAAVLGGVFPKIAPAFQTITAQVDKLTEAAGPFGEAMGNVVANALGKIPALTAPVRDGFVEMFRSFQDGESPKLATGFLTTMADIGAELGKTWRTVTSSFVPAWDAVSAAFKPLIPQLVEIWQGFSPISLVLQALRPIIPLIAGAFQTVGTAVAQIIPPLAEAARAISDALAPVISDLVSSLLPPLVAAFVALVPVITAVATGVARFVQWIAPALPVLSKLALAVGAVVVGMKLYRAVMVPLKAVQLGWTAATYGAAGASYASGAAAKVAYVAHGILNGTLIRAGAAWVASKAKIVASTVALVAHKTATLAVSAATKVWSGIQIAFNAIMSANPIMLVVSALSLLVAGVIYAYKHFDWFRTLVDGAWNGIKAATQAVVGWFQDTVVPAFKVVLSAVGSAFSWLYENVIKPVFTGIKVYVQTYIAVVTAIFKGVVWFVQNVLGPGFTWLWTNVIQPVFTWIASKISTWWNAAKAIFQLVVSFIRGTLATVFTWFRDSIIKPVFTWIGSKVSAWWAATKLIFQTVSSFIRNTLAAAFTWFRDSVIKPVWDWVGRKISLWWAATKLIFQTVSSFIRNTLAAAFTWFRDSVIKPVWSWIGDKIHDTWTFIRDKVFSPLKTGLTLLKDAFGKARDGIGKAWEKLQDIVKKPIKFVVQTVINDGIIKGFNKVADFFKVGTIKPISLPKGFDTGGYTGPGRKYQPAGVVHADEFVLRKEATNRLRKRVGLSGLDYMNRTGNFPGFANGGLVKPVGNARVSSGFGSPRGKYPHAGIDFAVPIGTAVHAALAGVVQKAGRNIVSGRTGIGMLLSHEGGARHTYYGHLSRTIAKVGEAVTQGQVIARSGNTGNSSGPHLHFETWSGNTPVDPAKVLAGAGLAPGSGGTDSSGLLDTVLAPFKGISGLISKIPGAGAMKDAAVAGAKKALSIPVEWMKDKVGSVVDTVKDTAANIYNSAGVKVAKAGVKVAAAGHGGLFGNWSTGAQWDAINNIVSRESSWNVSAANPKSSAFGLFQLLNANRGGSRTIDPVKQGRMGLDYIASRYGDPVKAWAFWQRHNWYANGGLVNPTLFDKGGALMPGTQLVSNQTRKPEYILPARVTDALINGDTTNGGPQVGVMNLYAQDPEDMIRLLERRDRRRQALAVI